MKTGTKVKLEKLQASPAAFVPSADKQDYIPGQIHHGVSIPVGYYIEGILQSDIEIGRAITLYRTKRNDIEAPGITHTSGVLAINGNILLTQNSVYRITELK